MYTFCLQKQRKLSTGQLVMLYMVLHKVVLHLREEKNIFNNVYRLYMNFFNCSYHIKVCKPL